MSQSIQLQVTQVGLEQSIAAAMKRVGSSSQINLGTSSKQINALSQPLGRITGQADEFSKSMAAANARVLAFGASAGIIAGVSSAMSGLLTSTIKVEKSLVEISTVLNKTGSELDKFGQDIFNVAKNTGKSFDEVASGALELARQGLDAEDTLIRLNDALILSRLSGLDAAQSVEGLTAAFNSFKKSGITTAEILNKVVAVSQKYAVSEKDIIEGVKRSASVAQQAGVSFDELAAVITAVQQTTARGGAVIGNSFKTIFARIQRKDVLSDLQNMGVAVTDLQGNVLPALRVLENLAGKLNSFSQIEQADIAEKLGGVFQLDKLLSALKDLSSEASVTKGALKAAAEAGSSAYQKNIILNQTLASLLNKVAVSAEQLGAKLGEIGVTDSLKNVLGFFNNLLEGIQKVLGQESGLGDLVRGLVKGIGNLLSGPGLALFGAIILKLSKDLVQFGFASLKAFFGIGKAAKEVQNVEGAISQILAKNVNLQQQLFALEGNRAAQLRLITGALVEQEAILRKSANISSGLAKPLYNVGAKATGSGLRVGNSADGYMPAVAKESKAIKKGVGGARSGDRPVVMPNFNFGGGKKGTMVAHTGEYVVPNFNGSGGSAVFNRKMVQSMGLPSGAKKIGAAGGFVPNFARGAGLGPAGLLSQLNLTGAESVDQVRSILSNRFPIKGSSGKALTVKYGEEDIYITNSNIETSLKNRGQLSQETFYNSNADPAALMLIPQNRPFDANALNTKFTNKTNRGGLVFDGFIGGLAGVNPNPNDAKFASLTNVDNEIAGALSNSAINILKRIEPGIEIQPDSLLNPKNILNSVLQEGGAGAFGAFKGALFESIIKLVTKGKGQEGGRLDVDLNQGREALESIFGIKGKNYRYADFKNSIGQKDKFISQVMTNLPVSSYPAKQQRGATSAAGGYIPNFAAQRNVGYLDGDVLSDPRYAATVKEQIAKLGIKGGTAEYHKYLGELVSQARSSGKLKKFTGIYGVPGAGKSTMMFGGGIGPKADAAKGRKTNRIPIITPEDIAKVSEVVDTRASLLGTMKALEGGYLSNVDRMMILSSSTPEEQAEIKRRRNLRDAQITAGTSATAFGRTAGTSQGAALDSGYIEAMALSILGPDKVSVMGVRPDFKLARKKGSQLPLVDSKKIGLAYGAFSPSTKGHAELLKMAQKEGISPENFIAAVSKEGGTIDQNDPHSWRTALFPQGFRNYLMQKTVPGANVVNASQELFAGSIPRMLEVSPSGSQRRFIKAQQGSLAFVGSDKTEKDLEKYIRSGYDVRVGDRTTGISGTAAREAIDNLDNKSIAEIFTKGAVEVINQYLPQMKNRSNIFPEIIKRVNSKVDNQLNPIEQALSLLPARKSKTTPPEVVAQMEELREARDKLKKLKQKIPNVMLRKLGKLFPDKYGLPSAAGGFLPNFANPLQAAVGREMAAGVPASQIYIDKNSSLKNAANPMGLMVANRRDEPAGGFQGVNRARREGANPMMYGAAGGFVPNYAPQIGQVPAPSSATRGSSEVSKFNDELKRIALEIRKGTMNYTEAMQAMQTFADNLKLTTNQQKQLKAKGAVLVDTYEKEISTRNQKAQQLKQDRVENRSQSKAPGANKDMLGTIFALQGAFAVLSGYTDKLNGSIGVVFKELTNLGSGLSQAGFAFQASKGIADSAKGALGKFVGNLGVAGAGALAAFEAFKFGKELYNEFSGANKRAAAASILLADAAKNAAFSLDEYSASSQSGIEKTVEQLFKDLNLNAVSEPELKQLKAAAKETILSGASVKNVRESILQGVESKSETLYSASRAGTPTATTYTSNAIKGGDTESVIRNLVGLQSGGDIKGLDQLKQSILGGTESEDVAAGLIPENFVKILEKTKDVDKLADAIDKIKKASTGEKVDFGTDTLAADLNAVEANYFSILAVLEAIKKQKDQAAQTDKRNIGVNKVELRNTIQSLKVESQLNDVLLKKTNEENAAKTSSERKIAAIQSDITMSASSKARIVAQEQLALEKTLSSYERQKTLINEIAEASKSIASGLGDLNPEQRTQATKQAVDAITTLANDPTLSENTNTEELMKRFDLLNKIGGIETQLISAALKLQQSRQKGNKEDEANIKFKEAQFELVQKTADEQERSNMLIKEAQSNISAIADNYSLQASRVAGQLRLNSPKQELALAQYNATTQETDPRKLREDQRRIIDEFFQKQVNLQAEQSRIEAEADFIRNLKVEENITRLNDNTKATIDNTNAILKDKDSTGLNAQNEKKEISQKYDSEHLRKLIAAEVGGQGQDTQAAFLATIMNRANARGVSIDTIANDNRYYEPLQLKNAEKFRKTSPISQEQLNALLQNKNINLPFQHNVTGGGSVAGQKLLKDAKVDYRNAINSGRAKEINGEIFYLKPGESGGTGITSRGATQNSVDIGLGGIAKAKELASLQDSEKILAKAKEYTRTLNLSKDAALNNADAIRNLALQINKIGEDAALSKLENKFKNAADAANDIVRTLAYTDRVDIEASMERPESTFGQGMENAFLKMQADSQDFAYLLGKDIPKMFSDGMSGAINSAIEGTVSLKDGLRSAAYEFVKTINQRMMSKLVDKIVGGTGQAAMETGGTGGGGIMSFFSNMFAAGGKVTGGSGSKDDVPAMLMGGEYVVNKRAVAKYGPQFLEAINNGTLTGYAKGGKIQRGPQGNFYTPGTFGQGAISGKRNLLDFATQTGTSGKFDQIINESDYQSIALEPESSRLSVSGMRNSPMFEATQSAKGQAFDLYLQQYNAEREAKKQAKEQKKALIKQIGMLALSAALGPVIGAAGSGFGAAFKGASGQGFMSQVGAGFKGIVSGGNIGGQQVGGLSNLFSSVGKTFSGDFAGAANKFKMSQIGNSSKLLDLYQSDPKFASYINSIGGFNGPVMGRATAVSNRAIGGMIPSTSGIDTVPAMLSGGEFVMNRSAVQGIGAPNLQSMNSGGTSITSEETSKELNEKLLAKLDELIGASGSTGNITINVDSSGRSTENTSGGSSEGSKNLARQIRAAVLQVINEEKRIGGTLRR